MHHFSRRSQIVEYAEAHVPSRACARAFTTGSVEFLGGFYSIPPGDRPGWILRVTSCHKRIWYLAVAVDEIKHGYAVYFLEGHRVPWRQWASLWPEQPWGPLFDGDNPEFCHARKLEAPDR